MHWVWVAVVFSAMILIHELGHFLSAKLIGVKVERFSIGFGPALLKLKKGETEFVISLIPLGGFVKLAGEDITGEPTGVKDEFCSKSTFQRFLVFVSGGLFNLISAFVIMSFLFMAGDTSIPSASTAIGQVMEGYPAEKAGLRKGDIIIAIGKTKVQTWKGLTEVIHKNEGTPVTLKVKRGKRIFPFRITPRTEERKDIFGRDIKMSFIGIAPEIVQKRYAPPEAVYMGFKTTLFWTGKTYQGLWVLITGQLSLKNVAGPIGIFAMTGRAAKAGMAALFTLMALISINLAVINLLPFPVLDGGHILFLGLEKLRGKPLGRKAQEVITQIALYLIIAVFLLVSYSDLARQEFFKKMAKLWTQEGVKQESSESVK